MKSRLIGLLVCCAMMTLITGCKDGGSPSSPSTTPKISGILPPGASSGIEITITGSNFGSTMGSGSVTVGGSDAAVDTWGPLEITCTLPQGLSEGSGVTVKVTTDAGKSATSTIEITFPNTYRVTTDIAQDHYPCWTSNDGYIYFSTDRFEATNWDIARIPVTGGNAKRATFDDGPDFYPDIDPSTGEIAWSSQMHHVNNTDGDFEIFYGYLICDVPSCALTTGMLTNNSYSRDLDPAYANTVYMGYSMAYTHEEVDLDGYFLSWKIYLHTIGPPVELTEGRQPNFSENGQWVVYNHLGNIYKIPTGGGAPIQLTDTDHDSYPHWGWANDKIVFQRYNGSTAEDIMVMNSDGTDIQPLISTSNWEYCPSWSPDCSKVVYYALVGGNYDIYVYVVP